MKRATSMLAVLGSLLFISVITSSLILKNQYNKIDRSDPFWNYKKLATGVFHHIVLLNSNKTQVAFTPGANGSVGVLSYWESELRKRLRVSISNDTLYVQMEDRADPPELRDWMESRTMIAISAPEIYSIKARSVNLHMVKMKQKQFKINLSGKSSMEYETYAANFDSLDIIQNDSTELKFEMADEIGNSTSLHAKSIKANINGYSILDIGHFQIDSFQPVIGTGSAITISGGALSGITKEK